MKVSELVAKLQNIIENDGDLSVFTGDMVAPNLELCKTIDGDDVKKYGEQYLFISE